jgi:GNAT superfamily N-acetyltransferase
MFCDVGLAARIERAECLLIAAGCARAAQRLDSVLSRPIAGGLAAWAGSNSPMNKIAGLGFAEFDEDAFVGIEQAYAARGAGVQVEFSTLGDPAIGKWLTGRGYALVGVENVLGRELPIEPRDAGLGEGIEVAESGEAEFEGWTDTMLDAFLSADEQGVASHEHFERDELAASVRDFNRAEGMTRYLARREGQPAGAAAMRVSEGIAQLCGAATLFHHRRRGIQSALLERRLLDAGRRGCTLAVATTLPGSKSQQNMQRQGFALLYARNILRREAT